ncbi:MAG: winged helix-turn-helix domain-containing protein [Acidobacteria bacterium]|nr:winged helix-turn-helix domain-containing protein [Acidobacteriota bacterium]MCB9377808.1 winged helix-turn-helix domain-containing protein [Holophagales bacterium]
MTLSFGDFELSAESYELRRAGESVRVEPRVFEVLAYLVAHRDRVVSKEELLEKLWPDRFVSESALTRAIRDARRALGDTGSKEGWVRTVHGRGFRFVGDVREAGAPAASPAPVPASRPALVVLPLDDLSGDPEQAFFADGMTETLTSELASIRSLKVISRTSAMRYKGAGRPLPEIAAELGVDYAVEGSVQRAGDRVRITAQLIQARDDEHLWAHTYDREVTDLFAIQSDVALRIAEALRATLSPRERHRLAHRPTGDVHAYQLYLQGRYSYGRYTAEGIRQGIAYFERAVAADPGFALAHVGVARAYAEQGHSGFDERPPSESFALAKAAVERAIALDGGLGEARGIRALLMFSVDFDWVGAEREFELALELSPNGADIYDHYGWMCQALERYDDAIRLLRKARELDPYTHQTDYATTLLRAGLHDEAVAAAKQILEFDPRLARGHSILGWAYLFSGRAQEGLTELERAVALSTESTLFLAQLGQAYALAGRTDDARKILRQLLDLERLRYVSPYHLAYVHTGLGELDEAIACLERAVENRDALAWGIKGSFLFRNLRVHPGFVALLRKMNLA